MELYIVRHGKSKAQTGEYSGPDAELCEKGILQAEALGQELAEVQFDRIFASNLTRAIQTAAGVACRQSKHIQIEVVPEFAECGLCQDYEADILKHKSIYDDIFYHKKSIGNYYKNDYERAKTALEKYIFPIAYDNGFTSTKESNEGPVCSNDKNVLIAAHGMFDAYLIGLLVGFPFDINMVVEQHNTCINHFSLYTVNGTKRVKFISFNDFHHLNDNLI